MAMTSSGDSERLVWTRWGEASVDGTLRRLFNAGHLTSEIVPSDEGPARRYCCCAGTDRMQPGLKI